VLAATIWMCVLAALGLAYSLYPYVVLDRLTVWEAAAASGSLKFVLVGLVAVEGGGCSGFQYRFGLETDAAPDDLVVETDGVTMLVDSVSLPFLEGAHVDCVETLGPVSFQVKNPNGHSSCGCGHCLPRSCKRCIQSALVTGKSANLPIERLSLLTHALKLTALYLHVAMQGL